MVKIFISYSRVDKKFVKALVDRLRRMYDPGDVWYDDGLHGGDLWWEEILDQIAKADIFIYVLSNESVQSDYCQAEFTEARRLQKAIITVQARDRTKLTDALKDIHYINMTNGVTDGDALTDLYRSIDKKAKNVRRRRALWAGRTPKPGSMEEKPRPADAPEVETPTLQLPKAEQDAPTTRAWYTNPTVLAGLFVLAAAVITGIFGLWQGVFVNNGVDGASPVPTEVVVVGTTPALSANPTDGAVSSPLPAVGEGSGVRASSTATLTIAEALAATQTLDAELFAQTQAALDYQRGLDAARTATAYAPTQQAEYAATLNAAATATRDALLALTPTDTPVPTNTPDPFVEIVTLASNFSGGNTDWTPQVWTFDDDPAGAEMVVVPVGSFEMGSPTNESGRDSDEAPHPQQVTTPYFIDRYEVTNAQFAAFLNDSSEARDNRSEDGFEYIDTDDEDARIRLNGDRWEVIPGYENHPVTEVTWFGGRDFCAGRGMSLPTELQWEYAASGPSNWVYPWGNEWNPDNAVWDDNNPNDTNTDVVGSKPNGASWVGAEDMSGNVWEWVSSLYADYPYDEDHESNTNDNSSRVLRGGSWVVNNANLLRSAGRLDLTPVSTGNNWGFRCARLN